MKHFILLFFIILNISCSNDIFPEIDSLVGKYYLFNESNENYHLLQFEDKTNIITYAIDDTNCYRFQRSVFYIRNQNTDEISILYDFVRGNWMTGGIIEVSSNGFTIHENPNKYQDKNICLTPGLMICNMIFTSFDETEKAIYIEISKEEFESLIPEVVQDVSDE